MKKYNISEYTEMLLNNELKSYLLDIDDECKDKLENNIQGFHIIQSFKGKELSPEKSNQIGKELAEELWGDKYQVLICTHVNKENVHNHIVPNSVSFIDGLKYHNSNSEIAIMKDTSDRLCYKYELSVVETRTFKTRENFYGQKN